MSAANTLAIKRTFPASCERVFRMWTTEELMKQWFCPGKDMTIPVAEVDAREGGSYRIVMQGKDGETCSPSGVYEKTDCAAAPGLFYAQQFAPFSEHENITAYWERLKSRPSVQRTHTEAEPYLAIFSAEEDEAWLIFFGSS